MTRIHFSSLVLSCVLLGAGAASALAADPAAAKAASPAQVQLVEPTMVAPQGQVNLNTADAATLKRELSGVGDVKARAIVAHRETHGAFSSVEQLLEVKGISAAILEKNRAKLTTE